ncbi:MAG: transcriptional repressor [Deltaproteobacteria bacterium]|nr:transcriptional repressor [Deltaproteobacteria bacterium]
MLDPKKRLDSILKKLRENNHKLTPQRMAIAKILTYSDNHPNAEEIYKELKGMFPTISLATVYRTILLFKSLGEVLELGFPGISNRYDGNRPDPHPHVICVRCKKIIDPDLSTLKDMTAEVSNETGFKIITHRLDFFGICEGCLDDNEKGMKQVGSRE